MILYLDKIAESKYPFNFINLLTIYSSIQSRISDLRNVQENVQGQKQKQKLKKMLKNGDLEKGDVFKNTNHEFQMSLYDYFTFWLPESWFPTVKANLYKNGRDFINRKLDMRNIIDSLNELEKLKLLLFDQDQYYLFSHIPKPILYDQSFIDPNKKSQRISNSAGAANNKETMDCILSHNASFWGRKEKEDKERQFYEALEKITRKKRLSVIDIRLLNIISSHMGTSAEE